MGGHGPYDGVAEDIRAYADGSIPDMPELLLLYRQMKEFGMSLTELLDQPYPLLDLVYYAGKYYEKIIAEAAEAASEKGEPDGLDLALMATDAFAKAYKQTFTQS